MTNSKIRNGAIAVSALIVLSTFTSFRKDNRDRGGLRIGYNSMLDYPSYPLKDTTPGKLKPKQDQKIKDGEKDYDSDMQDFDKTMKDFERDMNKLGDEFNSEKWKKAELEMSRSLKNLDMEKIMLNSEKAFKSIDWQKMNDDINSSLKSIDWDHMNKSMDLAFEQIEKNKDIMKMNWEKTWKESMDQAKKGMETAKIEMRRLRDFVRDLEKDGIIKKGEPFSIEFDHGKLIINGKEQPKEVTDKYRNSEKYKSYFEKDKDWKIKSDGKHGDWEDDDVI